MFWKYSRKETKTLLSATLLLASAFAIFIGREWRIQSSLREEVMVAGTAGVFIGVEENEVNRVVAMLDEKERELERREQTLARAETTKNNFPLTAITLVGFGLLGLILMNFYLDAKRRRSLPE